MPHLTGTSTPRQTTGQPLCWGDKWLPLAPTTQQAAGENPRAQDTHPLHRTTGPCPRTPPSLPSRPSGSAAGCATPAPRGCGTGKGASAARTGLGRCDGPSPGGPRKARREHVSTEACSGTFSKSPFSSPHCLISSIPSLQITKKMCDYAK